MSFISQFSSGNKSTRQINNHVSTTGFAWQGGHTAQPFTKSALSGAMTANTLKTVLSISGNGGRLDFFELTNAAPVSSHTARIKITVDGVVVFDSTSASTSSGGSWISIVATQTDASVSQPTMSGIPIVWNSSLLIEVASSATETDKFTYYYRYNLEY